VEEVLYVVINKLSEDNRLDGRSVLEVDAVMELLEVCLKTTYFQAEDGFYKQKEGMAVESCLSPVVTIYSWSVLKNKRWTRWNRNLRCDSETWKIHL
jgi:hypothetical protein